MTKLADFSAVKTIMMRCLNYLLIAVFAAIYWLAIDGLLDSKQRVWAQEPSGSSRPDGERRDRYRGRSGSERGFRDWRSSRSRSEEERRGDDRSGSAASGPTSPNPASSSSRSTTPSSSAASTPAAKPAADSAAPNLNMKDYATRLVKENDKNGNMMLEGEELKSLHGRSAESDLNHDGVITVDELVMHLAAATPPTSTTSGSGTAGSGTPSSESSGERDRSSGYGFRRRDGDSANSDRSKADADKALAGRVFTGTAGGKGATTKEGDKRRSYRFTRPADKLPTGLPGWFKSRDANGDGQVSMSEYNRSWSSSAVAEFRRYDPNDDGIITAQEAAKKK